MTAQPASTSAAPLVHQDGSVLTIAVSTSAAGTSLADDALAQGTAILHEVARGEREVGAILLVGTGANFCAGGNVRAFASADHRPTYLRGLADDFHAFVNALQAANRPVVAAVKGWAAGAGMSLVLHADVSIGGPMTRLRPAYRGIGLSPDGGLTWTLPRVVGSARARHIILTDQVIDADHALSWGLLSDVVADDEVESAARSAAEKIAAGPWEANAAARSLLTQSATRSLGDQLYAEAESISALSASPEGIEGVDAFVEKRSPDFGAARTS
ncbi:enoyl-CoA hydratase/isomerase family protein [Gordonia sp. SID5947]|uniref:enoyl-CoA hydratase/isomerase family protein n=1 Tax=Gordonia sp. SID5947 TaxID=2690315 RepID=UPI00136EC5DA|nr:enoyl-CoA hydratase-related protein [Gordonia sp. SID5947]MYR05054.1 enoyl-CoA hydratase/isomerase family protein [Gordonia sp. SID5947]